MKTNNRKIAVVGLGYVGLTIANAFAKFQPVLGFDVNEKRIHELKQGYDRNNEIPQEELNNPNLIYSTQADDLSRYDFIIIAVLTALDENNHPDLTVLLSATELVAKRLKKGDIVVFESTIFPGGTEAHCIPLLEKISGLICGKDFGVGYSPERINPGDTIHQIDNIPKIISATDSDTLSIVETEYKKIIKTLHPVSKIAVAEAAKVMENIQRDMNISVINELTLLLHRLGLDSQEVISAMQTKWNFLPFHPGLVGGYCIGTNTYYLMHRASEVNFYPELLHIGRRINENMPMYIASNTIKELIRKGIKIKGARIGILGLAYKENSPMLNYSKAIDFVTELKSYEPEIFLHDAVADPQEIQKKCNMPMTPLHDFIDMDAIVVLVPHASYVNMSAEQYKKMLTKNGLLVDISSFLDPKQFENTDITIWRL
jgi:UDP-N-acetyl-D-galactosamine dehydrogenase